MPVNVRIPDDLRDRIDAVRGKTKREPWIREALDAMVMRAEGERMIRGWASHDDMGAEKP